MGADLKLLDFFASGYFQAEEDKKKPKCLDSLNLAIWQSVEAMAHQFVQQVVMSFYNRVCPCVEVEGGPFTNKKFHGEIPLIQFEVKNNGGGDEEDEQEEGGVKGSAGEAKEE